MVVGPTGPGRGGPTVTFVWHGGVVRGCKGWCGRCYENALGRANHKGHYGYREPRPPVAVGRNDFVKRPTNDALNQGRIALPEACALTRALPVLWEFLTAVVWDDGKPRKPGTLLLFAELGVFKALLKDKACQRECWASADSLSALLSCLNEGLEGDSLSWKPTRQDGNGKR